MEHLLLKAATTATDQGTFTAVISTATVDRDKDIIEPSAMVAALLKWTAIGKLVPLAWNHTEEVVGHIDPASARVDDGEVIAKGWVDQSIPRGEETWRLVKSGTLSFSFGFMFDPMKDAVKLPSGRYRVKELDLFEVSAIPVGPANNDTRVLEWKSAEDLRADSDRLEREVTETRLVEDVPPADPVVEPTLEERLTKQFQDQLQEITDRLATTEADLDALKKKAEETDKPSEAISVDPLRKRSEALALEVASAGLSLRRSPTKVKAPQPDPVDTDALRQQSHDLMFEVLSYSTE